MNAYAAALCVMAATCVELIGYKTVRGMSNVKVQQKLFQEPKLTLNRCIDIERAELWVSFLGMCAELWVPFEEVCRIIGHHSENILQLEQKCYSSNKKKTSIHSTFIPSSI